MSFYHARLQAGGEGTDVWTLSEHHGEYYLGANLLQSVSAVHQHHRTQRWEFDLSG
jgi:hypothetical protein